MPQYRWIQHDCIVSGLVGEPIAVGSDESQPSVAGRITGVDLARGLAVLGMFAVHLGPDPGAGGVAGAMVYASQGRASILFATLAGLSLALVTGGPRTAGQTVPAVLKRRVVVRAGIVFAIGTGLTIWGTAIPVILAYYGVLFLIALPFLRLRPATNIGIAAFLAVLTPIVSLMLRHPAVITPLKAAERFDPLSRIGGDGLTSLFLTGGYPVLTWTAFVIGGIALGRLELQRSSVRRVLIAGGAAVAVLAYGGAWVLGKTVNGAAVASFDESNETSGNSGADVRWTSLLNAEGHTGTPFEILGGLGTAIIAVACCIWVANRIPRTVAALVAMGSMSLTVYVGHLIAIQALDLAARDGGSTPPPTSESVLSFCIFAAIAVATSGIWMRYCRRGPIEECIHRVTARVS
ncbi:acyltransferase family protein [Mycobacterium sp. 050134]|uniref:acyltransferase family protein n=1 Tax=Mycobacterium sp. 050134 TaxID=3096111 RepID=UPI002EDBAFDA